MSPTVADWSIVIILCLEKVSHILKCQLYFRDTPNIKSMFFNLQMLIWGGYTMTQWFSDTKKSRFFIFFLRKHFFIVDSSSIPKNNARTLVNPSKSIFEAGVKFGHWHLYGMSIPCPYQCPYHVHTCPYHKSGHLAKFQGALSPRLEGVERAAGRCE